MKKTNIIRKVIAGVLAAVMCLALAACGSEAAAPAADTSADSQAKTTYTIGLCNYVDDASLNQIVDNIQTRLAEIGEEKGVEFNVLYDNCNADASVMEQIISEFEAAPNDGIQILHIFGHSYEIVWQQPNGWQRIERLFQRLAALDAAFLCNADAYDAAFDRFLKM